jgi:hypothetical protein
MDWAVILQFRILTISRRHNRESLNSMLCISFNGIRRYLANDSQNSAYR